jgi:23S rRNA (pseudouridine1915-N3)-methyltransferase
MRLLIAAVGRLKQGPERDLFRHYLGRTEMAGNKLGLAPVTVVEVPESRGPTRAARTAAEAMVMLGKVPPSHKLVASTARAISSGAPSSRKPSADFATAAPPASPFSSAAPRAWRRRCSPAPI